MELSDKHLLLAFDEYEKLEDGIIDAKLTMEILNQLRSISQHRERIVVLFSGSHRFEELRRIDWSDYLINVTTIKLGFLSMDEAHALVTQPVPLLQYERGVVEQILDVTHCHPLLLQAVASELVNYLNSQGRTLVNVTDLELAAERVIVATQSYFNYMWRGECTPSERETLLRLSVEDRIDVRQQEDPHVRELCRKEILENNNGQLRFTIELFRRWIRNNRDSLVVA